MPSPHLYYDHCRAFENLHQNVRFTPERYYDVWNFWDDNTWPETRRWEPGLSALKAILTDANSNVKTARAFGAGWSLSRVAETCGYLMNTKPLNIIEVGLNRDFCDPGFINSSPLNGQPPDPAHLVFAQCGATIAELSRELENRGLSLQTSGASNGQTICGAMSTGTHGSAYKLQGGGAVQDYILGVHLIAPNFDYWVQSASNPVVNQGFCDILNTQLKSDDALFNAVQVAFGSFGIIHAVLLRAQPIYLLERHVCPMPFAQVGPVLSDLGKISTLPLTDITGNTPTEPPLHFEVMVNPYELRFDNGKLTDKGGKSCGPSTLVRYMYKRPTNFHPLIGRAPTNKTKSNAAFGFLGNLATVAAHTCMMGPTVNLMMGAQASDNGEGGAGTILTHGGTFDATQLAGHGQSCEIGVAVSDALATLEVIVQSMHTHPFASLPAFRYIQPGKALLGWTKFAPYTCAIEFPASDTMTTRHGYEKIWDALDEAKIKYTFHWGQTLRQETDPNASLRRLRDIYGNSLDTWLEERNKVLPKKQWREMFANPMLRNLGLS